jgi:hypothetical protein
MSPIWPSPAWFPVFSSDFPSCLVSVTTVPSLSAGFDSWQHARLFHRSQVKESYSLAAASSFPCFCHCSPALCMPLVFVSVQETAPDASFLSLAGGFRRLDFSLPTKRSRRWAPLWIRVLLRSLVRQLFFLLEICGTQFCCRCCFLSVQEPVGCMDLKSEFFSLACMLVLLYLCGLQWLVLGSCTGGVRLNMGESLRSFVGPILVVVVSLVILLAPICASVVIPVFLTQFRRPIAF